MPEVAIPVEFRIHSFEAGSPGTSFGEQELSSPSVSTAVGSIRKVSGKNVNARGHIMAVFVRNTTVIMEGNAISRISGNVLHSD